MVATEWRGARPKLPWPGQRIASQLAAVAPGASPKRGNLDSALLRPNCRSVRTGRVAENFVEPGWGVVHRGTDRVFGCLL
jgi:hypothetical protein